jgi:hypothetical protein
MVNLFIYFALLIYAYYYQKIQVIIFTIKLFNATKTLIDFTTTINKQLKIEYVGTSTFTQY